MGSLPVTRLTQEDYVALDRAAEYTSEYVGGEMFAISGGTFRHARLVVKMLVALDQQLTGRDCAAFTSDLRVRAPRGDHFCPAALVVCGSIETEGAQKDVCLNPTLLVEMLSPSSANYDRGLKFVLYREIPSLHDYLILHFDAIHVEHYTRQANHSWLLQHYHGEDARIELPAIGCQLTLGSIYAGAMEWPG